MREKPPIGLRPRTIHSQDRAIDIVDAMKRYVLANKPIPKDWFDELKDLMLAS